MFEDAHGLRVTAASAEAVRAFDHVLMGYVGYRADTPQRMAAVFEADAGFGLAHCLKGYFAMLASKRSALPMAEQAAHGVAPVLEMQGRRTEGIAWIDGLQRNWNEMNNLRHHLWWHAAMFHLERGEMDRVLARYDEQFRNLASNLTEAQPDLYIDVQNAASILFRLQRHSVDVGDRWVELADKAEARIGDCLSAFTLPHWMMALAATGRQTAAQRMLEAMRGFTQGLGIIASLVERYALPICKAVLAHARGEHAQQAVAHMRPVLGGMYRLGGSHAQQDVLEQLYLDAVMKAGRHDDARMLVERVAGRQPVPPQRRAGYAAAARVVGL